MAPNSLSRQGLCALLLASGARAAYVLTQHYDSTNFLDGFDFRTAADYPGSGDPTNGFVNYISASKAKSLGLAKVVGKQIFLGADNTSTVSTSSQGRNSVRLESKETFDNGILIADIAHMPGNQCGIWPAFWTYNMAEDPIGEIDIIEGISHQVDNTISLHTCNKCKFTSGSQTGTGLRSDCSLGGNCQDNSPNQDGCGVTATRPSSYGDAFNSAGGGVYATQLESSMLKIWHFPRSSIPDDITAGSPNPSGWGQPMMDFETSNGGCSVGTNFHRQTIIINIDFCGDNIDTDTWNGEAQCKKAASSCKSFVANHPEAFSEAYWLFNSIQLYQNQ